MGDLLVAELLELPQHQHLPVAVPQLAQGLIHRLAQLALLGGLLGARSRLQGGEAQVLVVQPQIQPLPSMLSMKNSSK